MKVSLAAHTLSSSVADAFAYCSNSLNLPQFENFEATIEFCKNINNVFNFLNTRNFLSKSPYKRPLYDTNI